ncbi:MAG: TolC family protein [Rickettsiaceae bacterium]|nr:TolC family protein [Rickettsiaceae bacterium]
MGFGIRIKIKQQNIMRCFFTVAKFTCLLMVMHLPLASSAVNFDEALESAYKTNPELETIKQEYIETIQVFPQTLSGAFLPDISISTANQLSKSYSKMNPEVPAAISDSFRKSITTTQPIFNGGGGLASLASAQNRVDVARLAYTKKEQDFLLKVITIYLKMISSNENEQAASAFVDSSRRQYEARQEMLKLGQATATDLALAKAQYAQALSVLSKASSEHQSAKINFQQVIGLEPINLTFPELPDSLPKSFEEYKNIALKSNLDLRMSEHVRKFRKNNLLASMSRLLPSASAQFTASEEISDVERPAPYPYYNSSKNKSYSTSLSVNIPILSRGGEEYSRVRSAKASYRSSVYGKFYTEKMIDVALTTNWKRYESLKEAMNFAEQLVDARKLAYDGIKSKYELGVSTILDLLNAEKEMYDAMFNKIQVKEQLLTLAFTLKSDLAQLTAKKMGFKAKLFDPDAEFRKTKFRIIGF